VAGKNLSIEIISDPVCPWCYVGKRRLGRAIEQRPDLDVALRWQPFQLNPDMPREGRNRRDYYREKFGTERAAALLDDLRRVGAEEGISFCNTADAMAPNTLSAHVLMTWAEADDAIDTSELAEKLFFAHHVACEDIGDPLVLTRIAGEVGMDEVSVARRLAAGEDEEVVKARIDRTLARGVSAVPFFIIDGKYGISGAQPPDVLVSVIDQIVSAGHNN